MTPRIPLSSPDITEAEIEAVTAVLRTNSLSLGPKLDEFEQAFAGFHGVPDAIAVSSGTAALHLAIVALNLGPRDEVIVPSFTFIAVANAVVYEGATPIFVDIDPITRNMSPACVEAAITPRTRAMIVVHTFGVPAEMDTLMSIAERHHLAVIEDACEAIGATFDDQLAGTFGHISTFAFYPNKQITTGEGGMILTRDPQLAGRMRALRNQGRYPCSDWLQHTEIGYNYRLSELACALGIVQLRRLPEILALRAEVARNYDELLANIPGVERPRLHVPNRTVSWFVYVVRLSDRLPGTARDGVLETFEREGIGCARYFAPIHRQPAYVRYPSARAAHLPVTDSIALRTLALPFYNRLTPAEAASVAAALHACLSRQLPE
jgi:perosamine synthetase